MVGYTGSVGTEKSGEVGHKVEGIGDIKGQMDVVVLHEG
jgi:hypothetical protein